MSDDSRFNLRTGEPHPLAQTALGYVVWFIGVDPDRCSAMQEALASCAIESNRVGEICGETLRRVIAREPVSDRYIMGLCLMLMQWKEGNNDWAYCLRDL